MNADKNILADKPGRKARWILAKAIKLTILTSLGHLITACATFPYIDNGRPQVVANCTSCRPETITLAYAMSYVNNTYDGYRYKLLEDVKRTEGLNQGLFALGAVSVGLAAFDAHVDTLKATGLIGASAYQLGTWNTNVKRREHYLNGMHAMLCIKELMSPMIAITDNQNAIQQHMQRLRQAIDQFASASGDLTSALGQMSLVTVGVSTLAQAANTQLGSIPGDLERASTVLAKANTLLAKSLTLAPRIVVQVEKIRTEIDKALTATIASTDNLAQHISSLSDYAQIFTPGLDFNELLQNKLAESWSNETKQEIEKLLGAESANNDGKAVTASLEKTEIAINRLSLAMGKTQTKRQILLSKVAELDALLQLPFDLSKATFESCKIEAEDLVTQMSLDRTIIEFTEGKIETATLEVSGGTKPYFAHSSITPNNMVDITPIMGGSGLVITSTAQAKGGKTFQIKVKDSRSQHVTVTVNIAKADNQTVTENGKKETLANCSNEQTTKWSDSKHDKGFLIEGESHDLGIILANPLFLANTVDGVIKRVGNYELKADESGETKIKEKLLKVLKQDATLKRLGCNNIVLSDQLRISQSVLDGFRGMALRCGADDDLAKVACATNLDIPAPGCSKPLKFNLTKYEAHTLHGDLLKPDDLCNEFPLPHISELSQYIRLVLKQNLKLLGYEDIKVAKVSFENLEELKRKLAEIKSGGKQ